MRNQKILPVSFSISAKISKSLQHVFILWMVLKRKFIISQNHHFRGRDVKPSEKSFELEEIKNFKYGNSFSLL